MEASDYTVELERVFHGPMDLLLHLVREQEVEIHEIEIRLVIDGYLMYLQQLESTMDIELAGDFVVMAATLMAIKSRSLLPHEEVNLEEELDPRDELIQRLIEYRRFRGTSEELGQRFLDRQLLHARGWKGEVRELEEAPSLDLGELTAWDLLGQFSRLLRETNAHRPHHIALDHRPLRVYVEDMVGSLKGLGRTSLAGLVQSMEGGECRENVIGSFCALLELVKLGLVQVEQSSSGAEIDIALREEHLEDAEEVVRASGFADEALIATGDEAQEGAAESSAEGGVLEGAANGSPPQAGDAEGPNPDA